MTETAEERQTEVPQALLHKETIAPGVILVRMQSPPVNTMTKELISALSDLTPELRDSSARVVIFTGSETHFSAGGDINRFTEIDSRKQAMEFVSSVQQMLDDIASLPMPVIAAINGTALGGGLELALACDIRIAGSTSRLGLPETKWGLLAGAGGTQRLSRTIGVGRAKAMMYSAEPIDTAEALRVGLVDFAASDSDSLPMAIDLAKRIAGNSPFAVRQVKRCVDEGLELPLTQGLLLERELWADLIPHGDHREGAAAFFDRRAPVYSDAGSE